MAEAIPSKKVGIKFGVKNIYVIDQQLNLPPELDYNLAPQKFLFNFEVKSNVFPDTSIIQIVITYKFRLNNIILLELHVANDYVIEEAFNKITDNDKITNENFLASLIELSITHTRGVQSTIIKGTPIKEFYLPFMSKTKIIQSLKRGEKK